MERNFWFEAGEGIVHAFLDDAGSPARAVRLECAGRAILAHLPRPNLEFVDVGGGHARQAMWLARRGHTVVVVDPDRRMLASAEAVMASEPEAVRSRIQLVEARGEQAHLVLGRRFDGVICHSVISYLADIRPLLTALVKLCDVNGIVSLLAPDPRSAAMRSGLARDWRSTIESIRLGREASRQFARDAARYRDEVERLAGAAGLEVIERLGSGVFVEHVGVVNGDEDFRLIVEAEWLGGKTSPYREIARCFHLICKPR